MRDTLFWVTDGDDYLHFPYKNELRTLIENVQPFVGQSTSLEEYLKELREIISDHTKKPTPILKKERTIVSVPFQIKNKERFIFTHRWGLQLWDIYLYAPNEIDLPISIDEEHVTNYLKKYKKLKRVEYPHRAHPIASLFQKVEQIFNITTQREQ